MEHSIILEVVLRFQKPILEYYKTKMEYSVFLEACKLCECIREYHDAGNGGCSGILEVGPGKVEAPHRCVAPETYKPEVPLARYSVFETDDSGN